MHIREVPKIRACGVDNFRKVLKFSIVMRNCRKIRQLRITIFALHLTICVCKKNVVPLHSLLIEEGLFREKNRLSAFQKLGHNHDTRIATEMGSMSDDFG